jgi:two-component system response regulator MprA
MGIIVVIEDDTRIQKTLRRLFEGENYEVQVLHDGVKANEATNAPDVEAVVLDLMLPRISGRDVCRSLKGAAVGAGGGRLRDQTLQPA